MAADDLTVFDVEHAVLTGRIIRRTKDTITGEWKYHLRGLTVDGLKIAVVVKLRARYAPVVITVYRINNS